MEIIKILDIPFAKITQNEALEILEGFLSENSNHIVVTPNPEGVMQARRNAEFREALQNADLSLADGTGVILASYLKGRKRNKLPERVRGFDITLALFERISDKTIFLLGSERGVAEIAKKNIEERYPKIKVAGFHHGFFDADEEKEIIAEINRVSPDILLVCTGMPRAEIWATRNKEINTRLTLCVGGTMDIIAGKAKLAPPLMRKLGLEWLFRLISQPSRFVRMIDIPRFVFYVLIKN